MKELNTSLLRERFIIHDPYSDLDLQEGLIIAASNRMTVELRNDAGKLLETFIVRTQNMHSCVRMAARIIQSFVQAGPLLNRSNPYDWEAAWDAIINDYEHTYNPNRWICIYNQGRPIFKTGKHHPLLDVIEKCDARSNGNYDASIPMAEDAFKQTGKVVKIDYDGNVALAVHLEARQGRCGVIMRGPNRTTTFNFSVQVRDKGGLNFPQCLGTCAAFLEGIQLAFMIGMNEEKIKLGIIERQSSEEKQTREARRRLGRLNAEIANLEGAFEVRYRPEKPEFQHVLMDAEKLAQKILEPPPEKPETEEAPEDDESQEQEGKDEDDQEEEDDGIIRPEAS